MYFLPRFVTKSYRFHGETLHTVSSCPKIKSVYILTPCNSVLICILNDGSDLCVFLNIFVLFFSGIIFVYLCALSKTNTCTLFFARAVFTRKQVYVWARKTSYADMTFCCRSVRKVHLSRAKATGIENQSIALIKKKPTTTHTSYWELF